MAKKNRIKTEVCRDRNRLYLAPEGSDEYNTARNEMPSPEKNEPFEKIDEYKRLSVKECYRADQEEEKVPGQEEENKLDQEEEMVQDAGCLDSLKFIISRSKDQVIEGNYYKNIRKSTRNFRIYFFFSLPKRALEIPLPYILYHNGEGTQEVLDDPNLIFRIWLDCEEHRRLFDKLISKTSQTLNIQQISYEVEAVRNGLHDLDSELDIKIGAVNAKMDAKFDAMNTKIDAIDKKIDAKFDAMNARFAELMNAINNKP